MINQCVLEKHVTWPTVAKGLLRLSDLNNIFRRKPLKIDSETMAKREFTPAILFLFGLRIIHSVGGE